MRTILYILQKEFLHIFRDRTMIPIIFVVPFIQLVVLIYAVSFDIKNIKMVVVDNDLSDVSIKLTDKFSGSKFFKIVAQKNNTKEAIDLLRSSKADIALIIPKNFEKNLLRDKKVEIQFLLDAVNQTKASIANLYGQQIVASFNKKVIADFVDFNDLIKINSLKTINIEPRYWYNPQLNYKIYMFPGILVILVTMIGMMLSAFNLIREKEQGTIEQINVTPIRKHQFIIGKILPFYIIALWDLTLGLALGYILYNIHYLGSFLTIWIITSFFLLIILGFGLLISTMAKNRMQVMFIVWFFYMIFILMSGLFTPAESMPLWGQYLNYVNPLAYLIKLYRLVLLKGSSLIDIYKDAVLLLVYGIAVFSFATIRYRKTA